MVIYKITNSINDKVYIGQTTQKINIRWAQHKYQAKVAETKIARAIRKYGIENFEITVIYKAKGYDSLNKAEEVFISEYDSVNSGYNIRIGGENSPRSRETREKLSKARTGVKRSRESCEKQSKTMKGVKKSEETRRKFLGNQNKKGKKHTEEWKRNNSQRLMGNTHRRRAIVCINTGIKYKSVVEACEKLMLDNRAVHRVLKGEYKQHKGYIFQYTNP